MQKTAEVMKLAQDGYSTVRVMREIEMCDVRCRNCHAKVTYERMGENWRTALMRRAAGDDRSASEPPPEPKDGPRSSAAHPSFS
ncbi:hypothetical protein ACFFRL_07280 [Agromyces hippuratus]|uniref:hypothetical protein n=1 Tax=Agromyces hippuratus TaxID=286438 RepID=UPI0035F077B5